MKYADAVFMTASRSSHYDPRLSALYLKAVGESDITVRIKVENDGF